jgi:hypothetical protein
MLWLQKTVNWFRREMVSIMQRMLTLKKTKYEISFAGSGTMDC